MTSKNFLPTLSEDGWVNSSVKVCDQLFSHFLLSDYSQTYLYDGLVSSFPWIILETQKDMTRTITLTQQTLSSYFTRYFNNVVVEVAEVENIEEPSVAQISIYLSFTDTEGEQHSLGKLLQIADLKVQKIIDLNNG